MELLINLNYKEKLRKIKKELGVQKLEEWNPTLKELVTLFWEMKQERAFQNKNRQQVEQEHLRLFEELAELPEDNEEFARRVRMNQND